MPRYSLSRQSMRGATREALEIQRKRREANPPVRAEFTAEQMTALAKVFCDRLGKPRANDLELAGFDLMDLLLRGLITREPGRYSIGYMPGPVVVAEMWKQNPQLCSALRLPPAGGAA